MPGTFGATLRLEFEKSADRSHERSYALRYPRTVPTELNIKTSTTDSDGTNAPPNWRYSIECGSRNDSFTARAANRSDEYSVRPPGTLMYSVACSAAQISSTRCSPFRCALP